jgi:cytochrome P450
LTSPTVSGEEQRKASRYDFDRHTPQYRHEFEAVTAQMQLRCPVAWSETYGGHFVAASHEAVFEIARSAEHVSSDYDPDNGRLGILIPNVPLRHRAGFIEMDPPPQRHYRQALNPYLSPAAVARWLPVADEVIRACIDEKIESGRIDFVDDLANVVPAVMTMGLLGYPMASWEVYVEPTHASVYLRHDDPRMAEVRAKQVQMGKEMMAGLAEIRATGRPGLLHALLTATIDGRSLTDEEVMQTVSLLIGGGFDTTTALTAHSLEWLADHPDQRQRLIEDNGGPLLDSATEEFLRFYTPAPGNGRTITADCVLGGQEFRQGDRVWVSWAMANRDPAVFENPNEIDLERTGNRHMGFGLGLHRCIGSNVARVIFKRMLGHVLERMPDYQVDPAGTVHYPTIGVIQGMQHLAATFTPGQRRGPGLAETVDAMQRLADEQRLAAPVTTRKS